MAKILILEDCPNRMKIFRETLGERHEIVHMETAAACNEFLSGGVAADVIFLDHDLGGLQMVDANDTNTGSEVVRHLIRNCDMLNIPIVIHSGNSVAAPRMQDDLKRAGYRHVYMIPFPILYQRYLHDPGFIV